MLVIIDIQHRGKPHQLDDRGAVNGPHVEAMLTPVYALAMEARLLELKHDVITISDGAYPDRHERACQYARYHRGVCVYLAPHLNAGGGKLGIAFHDSRSSKGSGLAVEVVNAWAEALPELAGVEAIAARPDDWTKNAFHTIKGVFTGRPVALCLEPAFIDQPAHADLLTDAGLKRIGYATAEALHTWSQQP